MKKFDRADSTKSKNSAEQRIGCHHRLHCNFISTHNQEIADDTANYQTDRNEPEGTNQQDQTIWVMVQGLIQTLLVRLPMAYFMSIQPDASLTKIGLAAPVSTTVGIILNIGFFLYFTRVKKEIVSEE